jgi:LysM repeat protein
MKWSLKPIVTMDNLDEEYELTYPVKPRDTLESIADEFSVPDYHSC